MRNDLFSCLPFLICESEHFRKYHTRQIKQAFACFTISAFVDFISKYILGTHLSCPIAHVSPLHTLSTLCYQVKPKEGTLGFLGEDRALLRGQEVGPGHFLKSLDVFRDL
jgi:hypothetical protein